MHQPRHDPFTRQVCECIPHLHCTLRIDTFAYREPLLAQHHYGRYGDADSTDILLWGTDLQ
jgi:hypothetical protein